MMQVKPHKVRCANFNQCAAQVSRGVAIVSDPPIHISAVLYLQELKALRVARTLLSTGMLFNTDFLLAENFYHRSTIQRNLVLSVVTQLNF